MRADKNDRVMTARARTALRAMNCNVLGVIVNSLFAGDTYGYAYYRKSSYSYYRENPEADSRAADPAISDQDEEDSGPDKKVA